MTTDKNPTALTPDKIGTVSPALARFTAETIEGNLWKRDVISLRDRSLVTVAALIQRSQPIELAYHMGLALDNGVKPSELSETITQLSFYFGWANGTAALALAEKVFTARGITKEQLAPANVEFLPLDEAVEAKRVAAVEGLVGPTFSVLADYTTNVLFRDLCCARPLPRAIAVS